jgi:hypothetical protein
MSVQSLSPPKPAGLDPKNFAGIPQIGCGTLIAQKFGKFSKIKKKLKKNY